MILCEQDVLRFQVLVHDMHFVKVDDSGDYLSNEAFERGQISDLLLRQCVKVLLGISSFH